MTVHNGKPDTRSRPDLLSAIAEGAASATGSGVGPQARGDSVHCPWCVDSDKQMHGYVQQADSGHWRYTCYRAGCGWSGDAMDLLARARGVTLPGLFRSFGKDSQPPVTGVIASPPAPPVYTSLPALKARVKDLQAVYLYQAADGTPAHGVVRTKDPETGRKGQWQIRYVPDAVVLGQSEPGGWEAKAPVAPVLYNLPGVVDAGEVWLVEGERCARAVIGAGMCATTTVGGAGTIKQDGSGWQPAQSAVKTDLAIVTGKAIYLWPDWDDVGNHHMQWMAKRLRELGCTCHWIDPLSVGANRAKWDVCDYLGDADPRAWPILLADVKGKAVRMGAASVYLETMARVRAGKMRPVTMPFSRLHAVTRAFSPATLSILGASPGKGKSFFMMQCALHWHEIGVAFAIMQMEHPLWWHLLRLVAIVNRDARLVDLEWLERESSWAHVDGLMAKDRDLVDAIGGSMTIAYDNPDQDHADLLLWIDGCAKAGKRVICVDPVTALNTKGGNIWELDKALVMGSKKVATEHNCSILFVTHPRGSTGRLVTLDDIAGGRSYGNFSQCAIWIDFLAKKKEFELKGACGAGKIECDAVFRVFKTSQGRGCRKGVGFNWVPDELRWAEQGEIT